MSTRSSVRNLFPPLDNPELTIRRRSHADPTILNDFKMATEENGDLPVPDLRTIEELCQPSLNGRGGPIVPIAIQATNFGLKNHMIQQVQNSCQFHGLPGDDANKHLDKFLHVTQSIKVNGVTDDAFCLYLFPYSLTHHTINWFDRLLRNSINTFEQMAKIFLGKYFPPSMVTKLRSEITNFQIAALEAEMAKINKNLMRVLQVNQQAKAVNSNCETCGAPHSYTDCPATVGQNQNFIKINTTSSSGSRTLPSNTITNPKEDSKGITTCSGNAYQGPMIPTTSSSSPSVVERETEVTKDTVHPTNNESTKDVQPSIVQAETLILNYELVVAPIIEPVAASVSVLKPNQQPLIPFADALILMPKFGPTIKTLLTNKDKLFELARTPLNEHCSAVLLKKLPEKLGDPGKFLIPCDFPRMDECLALADLGASINLMPLSVLNKLSLPELSPIYMTHELIDRLISSPVEVAEDVFVKAITFNLDQTSRYSANYYDMTANQIDVIDMACEKHSQEVLGFFDMIASGNPTPYYDPVELKIYEAKTDQSSIDEPPEVELKDLHPHLEYAFLEGDDKFPVIIAKDLSDEEKTALITVLKSHKRAIAWKLSDIKGINPKFCTHKIIMEEDFNPAV
nr:reverse transcriptase domain-containing protein [Tanacetum cinerariifolium]